MKHCRAVILSGGMVLSLLLLPACGGDDGGELSGSVVQSGYNMEYDTIEIYHQEYGGKFLSMQVLYIDKAKGGRIPVKVIANVPVEPGKAKDLVADNGGAVTRVMDDGTSFPDMIKGTITFDEIAVGKKVSGDFYITFKADPLNGIKVEGTLNGKFSGTIKSL